MATPTTLSTTDLDDIQGFVTSGYGHLRHSAYCFVQVNNAAAARQWLQRLAPLITRASTWPADDAGRAIKPASTVNLAFSAAGLAALGLPQTALCTFATEFVEGMASAQRAHVLGDTGANAAAHWELGAPHGQALHAVVILHADDEATLAAARRAQRELFAALDHGIVEVANGLQRGYRPLSDCEPFGFRDGIAQPAIRGLHGNSSGGVPAGEFILGHLNHYGLIAPTPAVPAALDPQHRLPPLANPHHAAGKLRDLGRNGSYMVYRKLRQDVAGFWRFMQQEAVRIDGTANPARMIALAAKCVGRWPSGAPLTLTPESDDARLAQRDDFLYAQDPHGYGCPLGAHVRRTNPRDGLKPYPAAQSLSMTEAHRILRRGRVFGAPLFDPLLLQRALTSAERETLLNLADDGEPRGIHFICINASIKSQFEFIQQNWCNNPRFGGLNDNPDPLLANIGSDTRSHMSIPGRPQGIRTAAMPRFVGVSGGAYLFMPSLSAIRFLAALNT